MQRPRIKRAHRPLRRPDGEIWIGGVHFGVGSAVRDDNGLIWAVCEQLDGGRSPAEIIEAVSYAQQADAEEVRQILEFLIASGWVEDLAGPAPANLSRRDRERYERVIQFQSWVDLVPRASRYHLQARLKRGRVAVLGLGGIGLAAAASLAATGVGLIHCVDGDGVELSNLSRQTLYTEEDLGQSKVDVATRRLRALNTDIEITGADLMLTGTSDLMTQVTGSDLFLLCADQPREIEHWADEASKTLGIPWIVAAYGGPKVTVGTFIPGVTVCYRCLMEGEREKMATVGLDHLMERSATPGFNPVIAATAQISASFAAMEALNLLLGWPVQTAGGKQFWNLLAYDHQHFFAGKPRPDCETCACLL